MLVACLCFKHWEKIKFPMLLSNLDRQKQKKKEFDVTVKEEKTPTVNDISILLEAGSLFSFTL